jgi:GTP-binding protein Era
LPEREIIPASARGGDNVATVLAAVVRALPAGPALYPEDDYTTQTERFLVEECVREQLFLQTEEEVPYGTAVIVDTFRAEPTRNLIVIQATILVDRPSHKGIVIGSGGQRLKEIGQRARLALEPVLGAKLFLELHVWVEPGWADDPRRLRELGL